LNSTGELRIWSCHAAAGNKSFIDQLERFVDCRVRAATGLIGAESLGGTWQLAEQSENLRGPEPPLTAAGREIYPGVFSAFEIIVSGHIKRGPTTRTVTYFVLDTSNNTIVGNIVLPDASPQINKFRIPISVARVSSFDVGIYDETGRFVSAGFKIETPPLPTGASGSL
jgi:hypothetical protein